MIIDDVLEKYKEIQSVKGTAKAVGCSWNRVVKILSSNGVVINDTHALILKLHEENKPIDAISRQTGLTPKVIQAYLPAVRPCYNVNPSPNAQCIKRCRRKKYQNN